jgi:hypothetical protein
MWTATDLSASFLTTWFRDPFVTTPFGFDPRVMRDRSSAEHAISAYLGLTSAIGIAETLGIPRTDWTTRKGELEDLVRSYVTDDNGQWKSDAPMSLGLTALVSDSDPVWEARVNQALQQIDSIPTPEAARTLCMAALTWRKSPEKLARIRPLVTPTLRRVREQYPADSYYAALGYIAAQTAYAHATAAAR